MAMRRKRPTATIVFLLFFVGGDRMLLHNAILVFALQCTVLLGLFETAQMVNVQARLESLGISLPAAPPESRGNYVPCVRLGNVLYLSGHVPQTASGDLITGRIDGLGVKYGGGGLTVEQGYKSARACAINILGTLKAELGDLDRVKRIVKVVGFVCCSDDFEGQASVINGASDLLGEVFGEEKGRHARSAVGCNALPLGIATEVECIVEVEDRANDKE